jgi:Domain of unknown function (DUF6894)
VTSFSTSACITSPPSAIEDEAARTLIETARDVVCAAASAPHQMSIEVRDDTGPVMKVKFTFEVNRQN